MDVFLISDICFCPLNSQGDVQLPEVPPDELPEVPEALEEKPGLFSRVLFLLSFFLCVISVRAAIMIRTGSQTRQPEPMLTYIDPSYYRREDTKINVECSNSHCNKCGVYIYIYNIPYTSHHMKMFYLVHCFVYSFVV